ncbi:1635_t:CDS:2, partial [Ambispora gerdemannii]
NENFNYYGITDESLCPLCKLDHDDDNGIEGNYKAGSYYIKCEQRGIEIEFPEEKSTIHEAVQKRFSFLRYTNSNAWYRDVFKYTNSEAKCPVCEEVHTRSGIWGNWSCLEFAGNSSKGIKQN